MHYLPEHDATAREVDCLLTIGLLAGTLAHDINNPLAGIRNAFMLIKDAVPDSHPHHRYVAAIEQEVRRIAAVMHGLVETYPAERERAPDITVAVITAEAVRLAVAVTNADPARISVDNRVHAAFPADACLLRHALRLVLMAALRAARPDQTVGLELRRVDGDLVIHVRYRGDELPKEFRLDPYPGRLIAVLSGHWSVHRVGEDQVEILLAVPMHPREEAFV